MILFTSQSKFRGHKCARTGSAPLMLMLVLALLVGTFAASIGKRALSERQNEQRRQTIAVLESAIAAVDESGLPGNADHRLPVDKGAGRWVIVEAIGQSDSAPQYLATLYHDDRPVLSIRRPARSDS